MRRMLAVLVMIVGLAGCSSAQPVIMTATPVLGSSTTTQPTATGSGSEPATGATLDAADFKAAIAGQASVILDVRTIEEFAAGHLESAQQLDVNSPDFGTRILSLDKSRSYAIYCRSGKRSAQAMKIMQDAGFARVYHLRNGIGTWVDAGFPVAR